MKTPAQPASVAAIDRPRGPVLARAANARVYGLASGPQKALLGAEGTEGAYDIIEIVAEPGRGPPLHIHREFEETFYMLEGVLTVRVGSETIDLRPGDALAIPAGAVHAWTNRTTLTARCLQITVPGRMEALTAAFASAWRTASPEKLAQIADLHGTTLVGPPI